MVDVISDKIVLARKQYKCFGCLKDIQIGEKHNRKTNLQDGKIYTIRSCLKCNDRFSKMDNVDLEFFCQCNFN